MRRLLPILCLTLAVLLGSAGEGWSANYQKGQEAFLKKDFATTLREWTPLAERGNTDAQFNLGQMYYYGRGVPRDYKTAVKWYRLAAEQGHAIAQHNLGGMYEFGKGVPQNYKIAEKWYRLSEEQGNANAQRNDHYEPRVCLASPNGRCSEAQLCSASPNGRCPEGKVYPAQNNN